MSTRHIAAEHARLHDLTPEGSSGRASKRFRQKLAADGFTVDKGFRLKPGYLYTVVRAISARVNQNWDGWPSDELKKSYKTFIGKPVFVNHENHDPTKARGVVVAARYVENGMDKYIEVVQEIDAGRFPKLAHEIKTGGLDSVSMGAEAGFTICSYCHNKATDLDDMCDHVRNHKGKTLTRFDKRTGKKEDVLVFESCHKISFFELSYVFEPADETAVASKVVVAGLNKTASYEDDLAEWNHYRDVGRFIRPGDTMRRSDSTYARPTRDLLEHPVINDFLKYHFNSFDSNDIDAGEYSVDPPTDSRNYIYDREDAGNRLDDDEKAALAAYTKHREENFPGWDTWWKEPQRDGELPSGIGYDEHKSWRQASRRIAEDLTVPAPPGTPTVDQSVIDSTPVVELSPATELTGHEATGLSKSSSFDADIAEITKLAADCPPGMDCSRKMPQGEQITKDSPNNPVNQVSADPNGTGASNSTSNFGKPPAQQGGGDDTGGTLKPETQKLQDSLKKMFPGVEIGGYRPPDGYNEHSSGSALDFMTTDHAQAKSVMDHAFANGANYVIWDQKQWNPDGSTSMMEDRGSLTQNHKDHVHINIGKVAGKYTKDDFNHPSGLKPWERDKESDAEDAAAIEIEAMLLTAADDDEHEYRSCGARNDLGPKMRGGGGARVYDATYCQRKVKVPKGDALTRCWQHDKKRRAGVSTAGASDDYWVWKAEHGEEADAEGTHGISKYFPSWHQKRWLEHQDALQRKLDFTAKSGGALTNPEHSQDTTRRNTIATYLASHDFLNGQAAPKGHSLDYGAGWGDSATHPELNAPRARFHTLEPHPNEGMVPDFYDPSHIDDGTYKRIHSLNVLNVAERGARDDIVRHIGRILAPGGHAVITTRGRREIEDMLNSPDHAPGPKSDPGSVLVNANKLGEDVRVRYQKGFHPDELHQYVQSLLGDGYTVTKAKVGSAPAAVHIIRNADNIPAQPPRPIAEQVRAARSQRRAAMKKTARSRALKLAFGEQEAPIAVNTLREEGSAPEDDNNDFEQYVDKPDFENTIASPEELQDPDLSEAAQIDRQQEQAGADAAMIGGQPGPASIQPPAPGGAPQQQYMTLQIPIPAAQQAGVPMAAEPVQAPAPQPPMQVAASLLDYFDTYYGRRIANWLDAIEANRAFTPEEAADYRRQTARFSTLENGRELSTTDRNPGKEPANMARNTIASRNKVARAGRRQHFAEGPLVDGGPYGRNDEGEQEEAFISQTPPAEAGDFVTDEGHIHNTEHNLVARVQQGRAQLLRDAQALASLRRRSLTESGGPVAEVVDPTVNTGPEGEALTGDDFVSANPNDGVKPTNPHDASLRAFQAFDGWLAQKTGKSSRRHTEASIKKAAAEFSREAGISPQALFPALGIVLREARKTDKQANTKGAKMRKRADEKLEVAAPDGRVDVEAPVENVTSAEAQASQFDIHDFGNNAGDNVAKPDLSTDQNWAPGEASGQKAAAVKLAGGLLAMRCAEGMIAAGLEPNSRERKYALAAEFERMNRGLIQDRVALLERFAAVREADRRKVASGSTRGAARSPIPAGLGGGTRTASTGQRVAAHDPRNDSSLFI